MLIRGKPTRGGKGGAEQQQPQQQRQRQQEQEQQEQQEQQQPVACVQAASCAHIHGRALQDKVDHVLPTVAHRLCPRDSDRVHANRGATRRAARCRRSEAAQVVTE